MTKILIVDDDAHIRELVQVFLRNDGFEVVEASDSAWYPDSLAPASASVTELVTGADLGLLGLLGSILLIAALFGVASAFWRRGPAGQAQLAS